MEGSQLVAFLGTLTLLLAVGRLAGELARRLGQPEVLGALASGILFGPSVLGAVAPGVQEAMLGGKASGPAFEALSSLGAVLLLLMAGLEVDLRVLRRERRPGLWVAAAGIVPSLVAGLLLGPWLGVGDRRAALYMGVVLSVTAVSVVSTMLIESGETRRRYAQVILAGGVAAEVSCWVLVSAAAAESGSAVTSGLRSLGFAVAVFAVAYVGGSRVVPAVMRFASDRTTIAEAPLTAVLVLALAGGTATAALGLHPLLGAFIVGVLLRRAPRSGTDLLSRVEALVLSLFAPAFFVLAGSRVDLGALLRPGAAMQMLGLLVVATLAKVGPVALGARIGGLRGAETWVVAAGMNLKGGTDVLVAIVGQQLHVLSVRAYTQYAVVAVLTVLVTPSLLRRLSARVEMSDTERERLTHEEAERRSYLATVERVLVPMSPELRPALAAEVVDRLARGADRRDRVLDVTQLRVGDGDRDRGVGHGIATLAGTGEMRRVQLQELSGTGDAAVDREIVAASASHDLVALGVPLDPDGSGALGPLHNRLIDALPVDVLVTASFDHTIPWSAVRRVLVPTNGTRHARAGAEVAAWLAESCDAELVLFTVVDPELEDAVERRTGSEPDLAPGTAHLETARFLLAPAAVRVREVLRSGDAAAALREEISTGDYGLVVMGAIDHPGDAIAWMGSTVEVLVEQQKTPYVLLVMHDRAGELPADDRSGELRST